MGEKRTAIVTGATSGIGAEIARQFARLGMDLVITGRNRERGEAVIAEVKQMGCYGVFINHDLESLQDPSTIVRQALNSFGKIDILINNAGDFVGGPFLDVTPDVFDRLNRINFRGTFLMTQAVLPHLIQQGWGRVVSISTNAAQMGVAGGTLYGATKAAVDQLTRALAVEFGESGVTFNSIAAGFIDTPLAHSKGILDNPTALAGVLNSIPVGRIGLPQDVAAAVLYLASEQASYVNGMTLRVDGGLVIA